MNNPFLQPYNTPHDTTPFDRIKITDFEPAIREGMKIEDEEIANITGNKSEPDFENTVLALEHAGKLLDRVTTVFFNLMSAETSDELDAIAEKLMPELTEHGNNISLNPQLFERVKSVYDRKDRLNLTPEESKLLEKTYDGFIRNGANLKDEEKDAFRKLSAELSTLTLKFSQNHLKETNKYELHITERKNLEGLPDSAIEAAEHTAKEKGKEGWIFTLQAPSYVPFMKYSRNRELRKELYMAYNTQCTHNDELDNTEIVKQLVNKRMELAQLLGFGTYADYVLKKRMAENSENVYKLLNDLLDAYTPTAHKEIEEIENACAIGYKMHTEAMRLTKAGRTEKYIGGQVNGVANSYGAMVSFATIFTQHGEIMHGNPSWNELENGRLVLCDAGAENKNNYCSDNTRTYPVSGRFDQRQLDIYRIVEACHDYVLDVAKPGVRYKDVHLAVCRLMTDRLKELGLMKGDTDAAVEAGAHALFLPHGLGHMMGLDVHDMEGLGQVYVGFDEETRPSEQFGTNALRMGRRLEEGFVVTDEPGIYFIPDLIDDWKAKGLHKDFINYDKVETYKDFGGIRIEDDILITADGCRFLGEERIPYHPKDVEEFMANN